MKVSTFVHRKKLNLMKHRGDHPNARNNTLVIVDVDFDFYVDRSLK